MPLYYSFLVCYGIDHSFSYREGAKAPMKVLPARTWVFNDSRCRGSCLDFEHVSIIQETVQDAHFDIFPCISHQYISSSMNALTCVHWTKQENINNLPVDKRIVATGVIDHRAFIFPGTKGQ